MITEKFIKNQISEAERTQQEKIVTSEISNLEGELAEQRQFLEETSP